MTCSEADLERLFIRNVEFEEVEGKFDFFCPFEAVGMIRQEVRHGYFLSYVLDPLRPHGFGVECLRSFMGVATASGYSFGISLKPLDVHLMRLDDARVRREWRKIDLLIELPSEKVVVAVELKIDAPESDGQLRRYATVLATGWPEADGWKHILLFLTKRGEGPSEPQWVPVDLDSLATAFQDVVARNLGTDDARRILASYVRMLRRHHLTDERLEELAAKLWAEHGSALGYLMERRPDAASDILRSLLARKDQIAAEMTTACGREVIADYCTFSSIKFAVPEWDAAEGMMDGNWTETRRLLLIELSRSGTEKTVFKAVAILGSGTQASRERIYGALKRGGVVMGQSKALAPQWSRLVRKNLLTLNTDDSVDSDECVKKIVSEIASFAREFVESYTRAMVPPSQ